jgi:mRNA-degrading endonuclease toxin of MazEF toxin-antitoxin module
MPNSATDIEGVPAQMTTGAAIRRAVEPALVVSVEPLQSTLGLAMVCAITTYGGRSEGARNESEVPIPAGLIVKGVVLPHQMRTIDCKARNAKKLCTVPRATLRATRSRLKTLLGL